MQESQVLPRCCGTCCSQTAKEGNWCHWCWWVLFWCSWGVISPILQTTLMHRLSATPPGQPKGKVGMVQMENIEHAQLEWTASSRPSHASQLEQATANESLNPMAQMKLKPHAKTSSTHVPDADSRSEFDLVCIFWPTRSCTDNKASLLKA